MPRAPYKPRRAATLKAATSDLVTACGGQPAAADLLQVSKGTVFKWTDEDGENADRSITAHAVRLLEARAGQPIVTRFLAAEAGCALVPLSAEALDGDWNGDLARSAKEAGDVLTGFATALADGRIDRTEAGPLLKEIDEALSFFAGLRHRVADRRDEGSACCPGGGSPRAES